VRSFLSRTRSTEFDESDESRLKALIKEVRRRAGKEPFEAAVVEEASIVMFRIATGQHFHEGNKRTSLVAGSAFLNMNGYTLDIRDKGLVTVVDRAGIGAASFNDVHDVAKRLIRNVKKWEGRLGKDGQANNRVQPGVPNLHRL
jgi:prophage maintenance system killer protein